jgi:single-strand DNA-binding protein
MLNNTILQGRLTKDVELKTTTSGISVVNFTIAWNRKINDDNEKTLYLDCEAWRGTADLIYKHFKKGNEIIVEGELYTNTYQTENGENRHTIRLNVNQVHFTYGNGGKSEDKPELTPIKDNNLPF